MNSVGAVEREWRVVRKTAGWRERTERGKLQVSGPDSIEFLQNMLSNDVAGLPVGAGCYAAYLTATGKMVSDLYCYRLRDRLLLDLSADRTTPTRETLEKFVIMEEVEITEVTDRIAHFSLHGPEAGSFLTRLLETQPPAGAHQVIETQWKTLPLQVIRRGEIHRVGYEILAAHGLRAPLRKVLERAGEQGICEIGPESEEILRVEAGVPRFGVDMDESNYPMEARLDSALSLNKGCYIGQEVVARATHIGGVNRLLSKLLPLEGLPPEPEALLLDDSGRRAGRITSAVFSLRFQTHIALGYVKRTLAVPGTRLGMRPPGGGSGTVQVVEEFHPPDSPYPHD